MGLMGNFACFLLSADFSQNLFFNSFRITIRVSNSLDPDQAQHFVEPDLGPNCLQRLSADDTSRQRYKHQIFISSIIGSMSSQNEHFHACLI